MTTTTMRRTATVWLLALGLLAGACTSSDGSDGAGGGADGGAEQAYGAPTAKMTGEYATDLDLEVDPDQQTAEASFEATAGTEEVTVTGVEAGDRISLVDRDGHRLVVLKADEEGQAHFAYLPNELGEFQTGGTNTLPTVEGYTVQSGDGYTVRNEDADPVEVSDELTVLGRDDAPGAEFYEAQAGEIGPSGDDTQWFGYIEMRDGVQLSATVRLPGPVEDGPYPTVVEYSGYDPSNPGSTQPGSAIAQLLGFATVGVNMRGSGCSGGVFDVFNVAQQVDGYDIIEAIAAQPWVEGHRVGMVGLSYAGITQLYTAATQPPSLAAIAPQSVIKDPWLQQWQGGVYNAGFTKEWLAERDKASSADGSNWVTEMAETDEVCASHLPIRDQNVDFESFGRSLEHRSPLSDERDLSLLVSNIEVPVFLTGAWQDEQTGPQFADMLGNFTSTDVTRFTMFNGRHPDGYSLPLLTRWYEFLALFVAEEVPRIPEGIRDLAPDAVGGSFGTEGVGFEPDRFADYADDDYEGVLEAWKAEPEVRVIFDSGAGDQPGYPIGSFEASYDQWPPADATERVFYLGDGTLVDDAADAPEGTDTFVNDVASGELDFVGDEDGQLALLWDFDWQPWPEGTSLDYVTEPFAEDVVLGGPGYVELFAKIPSGDADLQATISVIRDDGTEWKVTTGLLRASDRAIDEERSDGLQIERTYALDDNEPMPADEFESVKIALPSFGQAFRAGDRLRLIVSSPGRDFDRWLFETQGEDGDERIVARGGEMASALHVGVLPGIDEVPDVDYPCPSLRGQPCRPYDG